MNVKFHFSSFLTRMAISVCFLLFFNVIKAQDTIARPSKSNFSKNIRIGGGLGVAVGNGYSNIVVAPSAIYKLNDFVALGLGLQYSYVKEKDFYKSHIYGASAIGLVNPIREVQLSLELEQVRVNNTYTQTLPKITDNFWNTALFLGAGYCNENVTIGLRYNVLHRDKNNVYTDALMPFIRIYF